MMKRAKGATLAEIMKATEWQRHTVRGFVSILGSKGGQKIESAKNTAGERAYKIAKWPARPNPTLLPVRQERRLLRLWARPAPPVSPSK